MKFRQATIDDDHQLAHLDADGWSLEVQVVPPQDPSVSFFSGNRHPQDVLIAEENDAIFGYAHLSRHIPIAKNAHVLHLNSLVVAPEHRGKGVSHGLVDEVISEARRRGVHKLGLRALSTNEVAVSLYRRHGFEVEGRLREEFIQPDGSYADELWMALFLDRAD